MILLLIFISTDVALNSEVTEQSNNVTHSYKDTTTESSDAGKIRSHRLCCGGGGDCCD